jgi:chitin disaccharide deacetylase
MGPKRYLIVVADDFGIGPETTRGILEMAGKGLVTGSVLLANSPFAEQAVKAWRQAGEPMEIGWHPCLTLDGPILPADKVPSLVDSKGRFWPLGRFLKRLFFDRIKAAEIEAELLAQYYRFCDLLGHPPTMVNVHQHVNVFHPIGAILLEVLRKCRPLPYVRRVQEPWRLLLGVPGARTKRLFLTMLGKPLARWQEARGFPGNDWLIGITDPPFLKDAEFFPRWLRKAPGEVVELICHPGHPDATLLGRDYLVPNGLHERRQVEFRLLSRPEFLATCRHMGFALVSTGELSHLRARKKHAA